MYTLLGEKQLFVLDLDRHSGWRIDITFYSGETADIEENNDHSSSL